MWHSRLNQTLPTHRKLEVTMGKTQPPHQTVNSTSHFNHELLAALLLPQRTDLLGPAWRKHWICSSAQNHNNQRGPCAQPPCLCTHRVLLPLAILTFSRNLLAPTLLSPAWPTSWVNPRTGLWLLETHRTPPVTGTHLTLQGGQCVLITVQYDGLLGSSCSSVTVGFPALKPVKGVLPQTCTLVVGGLIEI